MGLRTTAQRACLARDGVGVSPIIGTLLVVAVTMVLAATVFVVVNGFGEKTERAPGVSFRVDRLNQVVTVVRADPNVDWVLDLDIGGSCSGHVLLNDAAPPTMMGEALVTAGDRLSGCAQGETLRIIASKPNQMIFETTF